MNWPKTFYFHYYYRVTRHARHYLMKIIEIAASRIIVLGIPAINLSKFVLSSNQMM